ncbi:hypothetical protein [Streptomyces cinereoruber]|uniref:hypothetical protein n=1 Tax=Streptomyces cinereoruber TaxID=67260 RepID=UPI00362B818B
MPAKTAIASLCGLIGGITITTLAPRESRNAIGEVLLDISGHAIPALVITMVALAVMKKWFTAHHERTRSDLAAIAEARIGLATDSANCLRTLAEREQQLAAASESQRVLITNMAERLEEANRRLETERFARTQLKTQFDDLAAEHKALVISVMQERANLFARRPASGARLMDTDEGVVPIRLRPRDEASPSKPHHEHVYTEHPCAELGDAR